MGLRTILENDLKDAMRSNDDIKRRTLRILLSAIKLSEIEKGESLDEVALLAMVQKEIKGRKESIADAERANRQDLIKDNLLEISILESYLPQQLGDAELLDIIKSVISELGATGPADMGKVIKAVLPKVQGRAPNDRVSQTVRKTLVI